MAYRIAGIDVQKKVLAVVVSDVEIESEYQFERRMFSSKPEQLRSLAAWLVEQEAVSKQSRYQRTWKMTRQLPKSGLSDRLPNPQASQAQA